MRAGLLNEIVTILAPKIINTNGLGEEWEYIEKLKTRAYVEHSTGNRSIENTEIVINYNKTFKVRSYVEVSEMDRILWNKKQYRIISIEPNRQYQELTILAELIND